ncbi:MAG: Holliday junction branch migration protein RuvA [Opitutales bacterium]|nr:Holliday junction branch migration protein RuvA [Opitutales bacterium]
MIVSLSGILIEAAIFRAVVDCGGVGYEVNIPVSTAEKLPKIGEKVRLFTLHTFREDGQSLYGFHSAEERDFFKMLIEKVSGIGPGIALKIFSRLSLPVLRDAIRRSDVALLSQCPGIGKKTAERLVVELRDKVGLSSGNAAGSPAKKGGEPAVAISAGTSAGTVDAQADAVAALMSLGFKLADADKAVRAAVSKAGADAPVEKLIRVALGN